ncbi:hypothetical protein [Pseudoxanthomonas japonensis]|uniref:hypothetical protein n=1 Tax=Pseudoxanthomonas japonensis TaxID=69284 RepID=UPI001BD01865|nr:hypothetical protein [Pseudoxanthomonas japonensis]
MDKLQPLLHLNHCSAEVKHLGCDDRFGSILLKNSVPEQGRHVTRQPEADLFDPQ